MPTCHHPMLTMALLVAIALRVVVGAPCCWTEQAGTSPPVEHHEHHSAHADHTGHAESDNPHEGHGEDAIAKPCCSACGPTLPPEPTLLAARVAPLTLHEPEAIRALATRPPFPAYEATGPPLLI